MFSHMKDCDWSRAAHVSNGSYGIRCARIGLQSMHNKIILNLHETNQALRQKYVAIDHLGKFQKIENRGHRDLIVAEEDERLGEACAHRAKQCMW